MMRLFRKARRRTARERRKLRVVWRALQVLFFAAIIAGGAYAIHHYLTESGRFKIATIRIIGAVNVEEEQILRVAGITEADTLLSVDTDAVARRVLEMPFIKSCDVKRLAPDTIVVEVQERVPAAAVMVTSHLYEIDGEGVVLREIDSLASHAGPMITSLPNLNFVQPGQVIAQEELHTALKLWDAFSNQPLSSELSVSEIAARSTEHLSMICDGLPFEIRWGFSDVTQQAEKLNTLWQSEKGKLPCQEYLDLRFGADIPCK